MAKTEEQLTERERAMMAAFAETLRTMIGAPERPKVRSPDELHAQLMSELRGRNVDPIALGLVELVEGCTSDITSATFDAEVQWKSVSIDGKIVGKATGPGEVKTLRNYKEPEGIARHTRDGGLVPDGMAMTENYGNGPEEADGYKQWRYESFYLADARRFVGRALPDHVRKAAAVAKTG